VKAAEAFAEKVAKPEPTVVVKEPETTPAKPTAPTVSAPQLDVSAEEPPKTEKPELSVFEDPIKSGKMKVE
jgi:hypothetical protein